MIKKTYIAIFVLYSIVMGYFIFKPSNTGFEPDIVTIFFQFIFFLFYIAPQALPFIFWNEIETNKGRLFYLIMHLAISICALYATYDTFFINTDALSGIVAIAVAGISAVAFFMAGLIAKSAEFLFRRNS